METLNTEQYKGLPAELAAVAPEIEVQVETDLGFVREHLPSMVPHLAMYSDPKQLVAYLISLWEGGHITSPDKALQAATIFVLNTVGLRVLDLVGTQSARLSVGTTGSIDGKHATALRSMAESSQRLLRQAQEGRSEAGFTKRAEKELGMTGGDGLAGLVKRIVEGDTITASTDVASLMYLRFRDNLEEAERVAAQGGIFDAAYAEEAGQAPVSEDDLDFLTAGAPVGESSASSEEKPD